MASGYWGAALSYADNIAIGFFFFFFFPSFIHDSTI